MRNLTRDVKIEIVKLVLGVLVICAATSVSMSTFVVVNMVLTFIFNIVLPTTNVTAFMRVLDNKFDNGASIGICLVASALFAAAIWHLINLIF